MRRLWRWFKRNLSDTVLPHDWWEKFEADFREYCKRDGK